MDNFREFLQDAMADLDAGHARRRRRVVRAIDATHVEIEGARYVNFASNDYLGLSHHPGVTAAAREAVDASGFGSGAAPLVTGYSEHHRAAENALADWKGTEDAVLLPSGYQANHAVIGALAGVAAHGNRSVRFLLDKLAHASLIDAVRATGAPYRIFPHNGVAKLKRLLADAEPTQMQVVVTESIFSMDGDAADLVAITHLKREQPFILVLDEAHATGLYGTDGAGYASKLGVSGDVDLSIVTLSKAFGGVGGAICGSRASCDAIINFGRAYLFSTSVPAAVCAAAVAAIDVCRREPWRRARVHELASRVRAELGIEGDSPIIPLIIGDAKAALAASQKLMARGLLVPAIRPPTVAAGSSRLRITVSSEHTDIEVEQLLGALRSRD